MARKRRMREALEAIGTHCTNYTGSTTCVSAGRTRDSEFTADSWCDQCIAREGLR